MQSDFIAKISLLLFAVNIKHGFISFLFENTHLQRKLYNFYLFLYCKYAYCKYIDTPVFVLCIITSLGVKLTYWSILKQC